MANSRFGDRRDTRCLAAVASSGETVHRRGAGAADHRAGAGGHRSAYPSLGAGTGGEGRSVDRRHFAWPDGRGGGEHFRGRRLWRLFHGRTGHFAGWRDGCTAAGIGTADERREEPAGIDREPCCGAGLYDGGFRSHQLAGRRSHRDRSLLGGWLGARYGRRLSPNALRAAIVIVGLIGLYRLLTV